MTPTAVKHTKDVDPHGWKQHFSSYNELGADLSEEVTPTFDGRGEADINRYFYNFRKQNVGEKKLYGVKC
jgi:hypothetical protein